MRTARKLAVWKSNNQGVKEETFIQTGRRGRQRQAARVERTHCMAGLEDPAGGSSWQFHICVRVNQEEQLGSETD